MRPFRWFVLALVAAVAFGAAVGGAPPPPARMAAAAVPADPPDDPFPIRRVRVTEAQLPDVLKAFEPTALIRIPRDQFESRVRKAALAAAAARVTPRVVEATYTATLTGGDLSGTAEWVITNPCGRPAALSLDPLKLALDRVTWSEGKDAVVGTFGPGFPAGPVAWVEAAGRHVLRADWSAAGTAEPGQRRFLLSVPPAPAATLDLTLPTGQSPTATTGDAMLTGPFPVPGDGSRRSWRFRFGGRSKLEFAVRSPDPSGGPGLIQATLAAKYDVSPGQVMCSFEYDLQLARGPVTEWVFTTDPGLKVTDVVVNNRDGWRTEVGPKADGPQRVRVALREPGAGGKVLITAVAPPPAGPLPMARPEGPAVVDDERIEVRVHPDLKPEDWRQGDYRLTESAVGADGARMMTLVGTLLPTGTNRPFRRPPQMRVSGTGPLFTTREAIEWRLDGSRQSVTARVLIRVRRGPLFHFTLRTPPEFQLDRDVGPDDLISHVGRAAGSGVTVEFFRPLTTGQQVELRFDLRGRDVIPGRPVRLAFPQVEPEGATERDGWLAVCPGPGWSATPRPNPAAQEPTDSDPPDPAPPANATATYVYRATAPGGELLLNPVRPEFDADTETRVSVNGNRVVANSRITLRVRSGAVSSVVVFEPGPFRGGREWRAAGLSGAQPVWLADVPAALRLLAAPGGLLPAATATRAAFTFGPGTFWVIRLARPATAEVVLETTAPVAEFPEGSDAGTLPPRLAGTEFSLLTVGGAGSQSTGVQLDPALAARLAVVPVGRSATGERFDTRSPVRVALRFRANVPPAPPPAAAWWVGFTELVTTVTADAAAEVLFVFQVLEVGGGKLPVRLPDGAEVRSVTVGGRPLTPGQFGGPSELAIPLPRQAPLTVEVRYRLPARGNWFGGRVVSPPPEIGDVDAEALVARQWWVFPAAALPCWPLRGWEVVRPADLPGGLPNTGPGDPLVVRNPGDTAIVIRRGVASAVGFVLAAIIAVVGWVGIMRPRRRVVALLCIALAAAGPVVLFGPPGWDGPALPPLVAALFAAAAVVARGARPEQHGVPNADRRIKAAVLLLFCALYSAFCISGPVFSAVVDPVTVFILPASADGPEAVLAPRAVIEQLDAVATPPRPSVVIIAADYDGRADETTARFAARFTVFSFAEGETAVALPLADARLESISVDGKPAHPEQTRPDTYAVPVAGAGRHEIEVRFAVPVGRNGPDREVRFGVPEVPAARLTLLAPASARQTQVSGWRGAQQITTGRDGTRLRADVGGGRSVQVRWREAFTGTPVVKVREACVWDVSEADLNLTACYLVRVEQGAVSRLQFDVPEELEPARVAVRQQDAAGGPAALLRDWSFGPTRDRFRRLRVDLQSPASGRLLVTLEYSLRTAPTRQPTLRFPRAFGMTAEGEPVYGLRASRVTVEDVPQVGDPAEDVFTPFAAVADLRLDPAVPVRTFRPPPGAVPELRPLLRAGPELPAVTQEVTWRVGDGRAEGEGTIRWKDAAVALLEFQLPAGARVVEVRGPDVAGWSSGGRVQVWLRKPVRAGAVEWVGTFAAPPGKAADPVTFDPPVPRLFGARSAHETLEVFPADGLGVEVAPAAGWATLPPDAWRAWRFRAEGSHPPPRFHLYPTRLVGPARGFALAEVGGSGWSYRGVVQVPVRPSRPHHLIVSASGLPAGVAADLEAPPDVRVVMRSSTESARAWDLDVPASESPTFRAVVVVKPPAGSAQLPVVVAGAGGEPLDPAGAVRFVGLIAPRERSATLTGASVAAPAVVERVGKEWPGEFHRLRLAGGTVWSVGRGPAPRVVVGPSPGTDPKPSSVLPVESPAAPPHESEPGPWSAVGRAVGWGLAVVVLAVLAGRFPRVTWPEQLGLLGALFGLAVAGGWWVGLMVEGAARLAWLVRRKPRAAQ
jgi:hypothetical protein